MPPHKYEKKFAPQAKIFFCAPKSESVGGAPPPQISEGIPSPVIYIQCFGYRMMTSYFQKKVTFLNNEIKRVQKITTSYINN